MMLDLIQAFAILLVLSFAGGVPFGPVNLSVLDTSLNNSPRAGIRMALAAASTEYVQAAIALYLTSLFTVQQTQSPWIKVAAMVVFIAIGLGFYFKGKYKKERPVVRPERKSRQLLSGMAVTLVNPQIIPFWVLIFTWLNSSGYARITVDQPLPLLALLLFAIFLGKGSALSLYALFSKVIKDRAQHISPYLDRAIGIFLVFLGFFQGATAAWDYYFSA